MPTYSYACTECDHRFDVVQAFTDQSLTVCPRCEGRLRKLYSSVGVVFKGSGFYRTDSRGAAGGEGSKGEGSESKSDAKSDAKSDSGSGSGSSGSDAGGSKPAAGAAKPEKKTGSAPASTSGGSSSSS